MKIYGIIIVFIMFLGCSNWDTRLTLVNNSNNNIMYDYDIIDSNNLENNLDDCKESNLYQVKALSERPIRSQDKWNLILKNKPNVFLRIYIIDKDTISKYGICSVFKNRKFLKCFNLTYEDLEKKEWKVIYQKDDITKP